MRNICLADINECWNDCACTGDEICENMPGSYICRAPTPGIMQLFYCKQNFRIIIIFNSVSRLKKVQEIYFQILCF